MKCKLAINENNQVLAYEFGECECDVEVSNDIVKGINQGFLYKYIDGEFIRDYEKETLISNQIKIEDSKQKLSDTDYIVTKTMEYKIKEETIPDELMTIINQREEWRNQIKELDLTE